METTKQRVLFDPSEEDLKKVLADMGIIKLIGERLPQAGSGAKFQLATRHGKRRKHFLRYMVAIFNYSSYLHQNPQEGLDYRYLEDRFYNRNLCALDAAAGALTFIGTQSP